MSDQHISWSGADGADLVPVVEKNGVAVICGKACCQVPADGVRA